MMEVNVEIDQASRRKMEQVLRNFEKATGKTVEDGIAIVAQSAGRRLAHTVQPFGLTEAKGGKLQGSIAKQVVRAVRNANVTGASGDAASIHRSRRDHRGQVPKGLATEGQYKRDPVVFWDVERQIKKAQSKAGKAKGAWVQATEQIGAGKMSGVGQWIRRHASGGYGSATKTGKGMSHKLTLQNRTPYIEKIQTSKSIAEAVGTGMKNGFKRIQKMIDKSIEKANREMQ